MKKSTKKTEKKEEKKVEEKKVVTPPTTPATTTTGQSMTCIPTPKGSTRLSLSTNEMSKLAGASTGKPEQNNAQITAEYLSEPDFADYALF